MSEMALSLRRIGAMMLRHYYVLRGSWPRLIELAYWPTMQMIIWGFMTQFLATNSSWVAQAFGVLLAGVLLWDTLFRARSALLCRSSRRCGRATSAICS